MLIELIYESSQKKPRILKFNKGLIFFISKIGDLLKLPLNSIRLKKLTENYIVSNSKIKNSIGIEQLPITPEEGMKRTIESFKN